MATASVCSRCGSFTSFGMCENCGVMSYQPSAAPSPGAGAGTTAEGAPGANERSAAEMIRADIAHARAESRRLTEQYEMGAQRSKREAVYMTELERQFWTAMADHGYPGCRVIEVFAPPVPRYGSWNEKREARRKVDQAAALSAVRGWEMGHDEFRYTVLLTDRHLVSIEAGDHGKLSLHEYLTASSVCSHSSGLSNTPLGWKDFMLRQLAFVADQ